MRYHRKPRIEVLPPQEEPKRVRVEMAVTRHRQRRNFLPIFIAIVVLVLLWRYPFGFLMLAAIGGWQAIGAIAFAVAIVGAAALIERRAGRPF
jgi:hypothetical protein